MRCAGKADPVLCVAAVLVLAYGLLINPLYGTFPATWPLPEPDPWIDRYAAGLCTLPDPSPAPPRPSGRARSRPCCTLSSRAGRRRRRRHVDNEERTAAMF